jgi:hypothetical protein
MNMICGWCPSCLALRPDVTLDDPCPECRGCEARAERLEVGFRCTHHNIPWPEFPPGVGDSKNKRRPARKTRPKKSARRR